MTKLSRWLLADLDDYVYVCVYSVAEERGVQVSSSGLFDRHPNCEVVHVNSFQDLVTGMVHVVAFLPPPGSGDDTYYVFTNTEGNPI